MEEHNKNIDRLIKQSLKVEAPSSDFAGKVMDQIYSADLKKEKALSSLMQNHILVEAPLDFTSNVLAAIKQESIVHVGQPIFSKKAWFLMGSLVAFVVLFSLFNMEVTDKYAVIGDTYAKSLEYISIDLPTISISPLYALSIFVLSSLLFLDYSLRNRLQS